VGDAHIANGSIDFVSMGRKLLADPHLPRKLTEGRPDDVLPCIYCYTCISAIYAGDSMRCAVNPETGFEYLRQITREGQKRIVVIGGGPGGMEAARRLDAAGHRVTLIEQSERLGGTLRIAALAYPANERLLDWLRHQLATSRVDVRLNTTVTPELLAELKPDAVIVATGAMRTMPSLPGNEQAHVFSGDDMRKLLLGESSSELQRKTSWFTRLATKIGAASGLTANLNFVRTFTQYWMPVGKRIVIIGGELVGLELAEFLSERGRTVTVIEETPRLGAGLTIVRRMRLLEELKEHGLGLYAGASDIRIDGHTVRFVDANGNAQALDADQVIVAKGATGNLTLADALKAQGFNVHTVGDCNGVSYIEGAMRGAAQAVYAISNG
jgi:NADPH-dependent 2,4-dienoyl-CoA reductase/sulfur reductase-like enzyme